MSWFPWVHPNLTANVNGNPKRRLEDALFHTPAQPLRLLRVMIDASLRITAKNDQKVAYLLQLLAHPSIESMFYAIDGPPNSSIRSVDTNTGAVALEDWISVNSNESEEFVSIHYWKDLRPHELRVKKGNLLSVPEVSGGEYWRSIAERTNCDLLITNAGTILDYETTQWGRVTSLGAYDAIPIVGLYLRCQNQFVNNISPSLGLRSGQQNIGKITSREFYLKAAGIFLPAAAQGPSSHQAEFTTRGFNDHCRAVTWRVAQALQYRDKLIQVLAVAPRDHLASELAAELVEVILLWLMAAFDVTSRLVHSQFGREESKQRPGWQHEKWRKSLGRPDLARFFKRNAEAGEILEIVNLLRNMIHGSTPISGLGQSFIVGPHAMQCLISVHHLDQSQQSSLTNVFKRLGGAKSWGAEVDSHTGTFLLRPGEFVEQLFPLAAAAINGSLEINPDIRRRASTVGGPYELQLHEKRTLWQLGFRETDVPER